MLLNVALLALVRVRLGMSRKVIITNFRKRKSVPPPSEVPVNRPVPTKNTLHPAALDPGLRRIARSGSKIGLSRGALLLTIYSCGLTLAQIHFAMTRLLPALL